MSDMTLVPSNAFGNGGLGDAGAAALGAFVGSWFGNGWMGGWGNRGVGMGADAAAIGAAAGTNLVMDNLNQIQNGINNLGLNLTQGQCAIEREVAGCASGIQSALCQGFSGVTAAVNNNSAQLMNANNQGFAGLNNTINQTNAMTNSYLAQGFSGINSAIRDNGYETRLSVSDLARQNADCCCAIKNTVQSEGAATRQLIQNNLITELQTKLCDAKSRIASLENQQYTSASNAAQTAAIIAALKPASTTTSA